MTTLPQKTLGDAIYILLEAYGESNEEEVIANYIHDSVCPAVCMNEGCENTAELEHDCSSGYCDECDTNSMKSLMIVMGII